MCRCGQPGRQVLCGTGGRRARSVCPCCPAFLQRMLHLVAWFTVAKAISSAAPARRCIIKCTQECPPAQHVASAMSCTVAHNFRHACWHMMGYALLHFSFRENQTTFSETRKDCDSLLLAMGRPVACCLRSQPKAKKCISCHVGEDRFVCTKQFERKTKKLTDLPSSMEHSSSSEPAQTTDKASRKPDLFLAC